MCFNSECAILKKELNVPSSLQFLFLASYIRVPGFDHSKISPMLKSMVQTSMKLIQCMKQGQFEYTYADHYNG